MKLSVITPTFWLKDEADIIVYLLDNGIDYIRIRKPFHKAYDMENLLSNIPEEKHSRLIIHKPLKYIHQYPMIGIHHPDHKTLTPFHDRICSTTMHHEKETNKLNAVDQVLISPIFDSISKTGYLSAWDKDRLKIIHQYNEIDWIALGGVSAQRLPELAAMNFKHAALMGYFWKQTIHNETIDYTILDKKLVELNRIKNEI